VLEPELHVLTGGRAGVVHRLTRDTDTVTLGRHPRSDLRFDADADLAVSAVHAAITRDGERWYVQDLGSTNGTLLDGTPVERAMPLEPGARIALGGDGPVVEFRVSGRTAALGSHGEAGAAAGLDRRGPADPGRSAVGRRPLVVPAAAAAVVLLLAVALAAVLILAGRRERAEWAAERDRMRASIDSALHAGEVAVQSLEGQLSALALALQASQEQVRRTGEALERARRRGDTGQVQQLERELDAATGTLQRQNSAALLDFRSIQARNRRAIALVYVESASGEVSTGTAFAVRPDATLITNRHVVLGSDPSRPPRRVAVQFSDSDQVWPARLVGAFQNADLAVIKVDNIAGSVPVVQGLNLRPDSLAAGAPVVLIGFPHGGDGGTPNGASQLARPVVGSGAITRVTASRLELEGYGASGASGSPVFDANGDVVGVLFGGRAAAAGGQTVYAVPAPVAARLLASIP
jgi:S1-C subfamily serine protease